MEILLFSVEVLRFPAHWLNEQLEILQTSPENCCVSWTFLDSVVVAQRLPGGALEDCLLVSPPYFCSYFRLLSVSLIFTNLICLLWITHLKWRVFAVQECAQEVAKFIIVMIWQQDQNCVTKHDADANWQQWIEHDCVVLHDADVNDNISWLRGTARCVHHWPLPLTPTWA